MRRVGYPLLLAAVACLVSAPVSAAVIYETDYTTRNDNGNPFNPGGELRFQDGWLGQTGYIVDSSGTGTVSTSSRFARTLHNQGATGGVAGAGGVNEAGNDFNNGDTIRIVTTLQYNLSTDPNQALSTIGVRPNFVLGGFDASPTVGFEVAYNAFADGSLKVFTNFARAGFNGADNAFALFVDGPDAGFNSGGAGGTPDFVTDTLEFEYTAVFDNDAWTATDVIVRNLDNGGIVVAQASVDKPGALETVAYTGTEAFYGQRFTDAAGVTVTSDRMRFEYTAVPEPTSLALIGLLSLGFAGASRRS